MKIQFGFFDLQNRFDKLSQGGDALERLNAIVDWAMFRADLERIDRKERKSAAGRKPTDRVRMFKMLVLQHLYGLSDEALEYQVTDRLTFMRFLGIDLGGTVPDAKTVWLLMRAKVAAYGGKVATYGGTHRTCICWGIPQLTRTSNPRN